MLKYFKYLILILLLIILTSCVQQKAQEILTIKNIAMKLTSKAFLNNSNLPAKYTCDGQNINPALQISEVADNAQSLVLIFEDPDAPVRTFVHWLVWNIDPKTTEIAENSVPEGARQGLTSAGRTGYVPPCPPSGTHRYIFKLYALDTVLNLTPNAGKDNLEQAMQGHILDATELIGLYSRQK
jgi:hypothetical protein